MDDLGQAAGAAAASTVATVTESESVSQRRRRRKRAAKQRALRASAAAGDAHAASHVSHVDATGSSATPKAGALKRQRVQQASLSPSTPLHSFRVKPTATKTAAMPVQLVVSPKLHVPTQVPSTGLGAMAAAGVKVKVSTRNIWDPDTVISADVLASACAGGRSSSSARQAPPRPTPKVETVRMHQMLRLKHRLAQLLTAKCGPSAVVPVMAFERWLARAQLNEEVGAGAHPHRDPLIPRVVVSDRELVADIVRRGTSHPVAASIVAQLEADSASAAARVLSAQQAMLGAQAAGGGASPAILQVELVVHRHSLDVMYGPELLKLTPAHLQKLRTLYEGASCDASPGAVAPVDEAAFNNALYCMLARYHALQGHGYQAALCEHAFEVLRERFGVTFECFASPLNCRYGRYCSAFPDTDSVFGSVGSFFSFKPTTGCYEVNPPFVEEVMLATVRHMDALLQPAGSSRLPLAFVVIVPGWTESGTWRQLSASPFLQASWLVSKADHGFCDGAQHQRQDRFRESPYDTTVFVLQNAAAAARWPASQAVQTELLHAMAQSVPTAAAVQRRLKEGRGKADLDGGGAVYKGKKRAHAAAKRDFHE